MHFRLKETPGGIPATPARRMISAVVIAVFASAVTGFVLFKFGSSEPIVNDYPKLVFKSVFMHDARATYYSSGGAANNIVIPIFKWLAVAAGSIVWLLVWRSTDPKRKKPVIADGQRADSRGMLTAQKAKQAKRRNRT